MIHAIQAAWGPWSEAMWRASWQGAVAVAVGWAICRSFPNLPAALKCWVWRAVYLKLILSLLWLAPVELPVFPGGSPAGGEAHSFIEPRLPAVEPATATPEAASPPTRPGAAESDRLTWTAWLMLAWAAGAAACVVQLVRRWRAVACEQTRWRHADCSWLLDTYARAARMCGMTRPPPIWISGDCGGPRLVGLFRPAIILPAALLQSREELPLQLLLAHELAHWRRRDLWWTWLPAAGRILFWFHPAVWIAERQWRLAEEAACDQAAIAATQSRTAEYARMLIDVASRFSSRSRLPVAIGVVDFKKTLERRLLAMRSITSWSSRKRISFGLVLAFVAAMAIVPWRLVAQEKESRGNQTASTNADAAPAVHPPLHDRDHFHAESADHDTRLRQWLQDNVVMGQIIATSANVGSRTQGVAREIRCAEGSRVKKGDLLIALDDERARAAVERAVAEYRKADVTCQRIQRLLKDKSVSQAEMDAAEADRDIAAVGLRLARQTLAETRVESPMDGVITECSVTAGQMIDRGGSLAKVMDVDDLRVQFDVDSDQYPYLRVGQKVRISLSSPPESALPATISFLSPTVDPLSNRLRVKATIEDPRHRLKPGMQVQVDLQLYREQDLPH